MSSWHVYVLKLQKDKWYVGVTRKDPEVMLNEHKAGKGTAWTKKYKPVSLAFKRDMGELPAERAEMLVDRAMRKYVKEHGVDNVRGGYLDGIEATEKKSKRVPKIKMPASEGQVVIFALVEAIVIIVLLVQRLPK